MYSEKCIMCIIEYKKYFFTIFTFLVWFYYYIGTHKYYDFVEKQIVHTTKYSIYGKMVYNYLKLFE